jgi:photosystem II stability/assembly factor-like uncharacterized protein
MKKLLFACFFFLPVFAFSQEEWELIHGSDDAFIIYNAYVLDSNHIWGQENHSMYFSDDFGETWTEQFFYDTNYFTCTYFVDTLHGWACGDDDIIHTEDGGLSWAYQTLPNDMWMDMNSVFFLNRDTGWVAGSYLTIFSTVDGGDYWTKIHESVGPGMWFLNEIQFCDALHGCAVGGKLGNGEPVVMVTSDGGETWTDIFPDYDNAFNNLQFVNRFVVWATEDNGRILKSEDQGYTWELVRILPGFYNPLMHFFNENDAFISDGFTIDLALTNDAWSTYQYNNMYHYNWFSQLSFDKGLNGMASGNHNLLRTRDGGQNWERMNDRFVQIAFFDQMNGWIIPEYLNKKLLRTIDGGLTWNEVETGHTGMFHQMYFVDDHLGFILTGEPELLKTADAGVSWEIISLPFDSSWYFSELQFLDENTGIIAAYPNLVYKTLNGGQDWETFELEMANIRGADFIDDQEGWVVATDGNVAHTYDGGVNWKYSTLPSSGLHDVDFINPLTGFIVTGGNILYKTTNGGNIWQDMHILTSAGLHVNFQDEHNGWLICEDEILRTYDGGSTWIVVLENNSSTLQHDFTGFFALDSGNAWVCSMDGRVHSCADFVGIEEDGPVSDVTIYPNPVHNLLNVDLNNKDMGDLSLRIFSIDGKLLMVKEFQSFPKERITLDLTGYSPGIYFLNLQGTYNSSCFKVIKN